MAQRYVIRMGRSIPGDEVFEAWMSADLDKMLAVIEKPTNPIDRHFLLLGIVQATYKRRKEPELRKLCKGIARKHIAEFKDIAPALKLDMGGMIPRVPTFQYFATLLVEDGDSQSAIEVCEAALGYGLNDGTKGGFQGRIEKIKKKKQNS